MGEGQSNGRRRPERRRRSAPAATPMIEQYLDIKSAHPDALLFYRMGDFYEMFFDDAVRAAAALDIALTRRGKHEGRDIPMCGVPVHNRDPYLERLIRAGFRVAICEQTEDPAEARKRGPKAVVARRVVRLVTPGTLVEDGLLEARSNNHLAAVARAGGAWGAAWLDLSTGDFTVAAPSPDSLAPLLAQVAPGELLVSETLAKAPELAEWADGATALPTVRFDSAAAERRLREAWGVASLEAFGTFSRAETAAAGALIDYLDITQKGRKARLSPPRRQADGATMAIDAATRRNLELTRALDGGRRGSLLDAVDRTRTAGGGRLLAARLAAPLTDPAAIGARLDMVGSFVADAAARDAAREALAGCPDAGRALGRLCLGRGGPRDLAALREALARAEALRRRLTEAAEGALAPPPDGIAAAAARLGAHGVLIDRLTRALAPDLPTQARDGGFIAEGYAVALDEQRALRDESRRLIGALQSEYAARSGVSSLKIKHNNVLGYFVEVGAGHGDKLFADAALFIHRQTMAGAVRFSTVALAELADKIARAADRALALELELFDDLVGEAAARADDIAATADALAAIDIAAAGAALAVERDYCRPEVDGGTDFRVAGGRHPVVEAAGAEGGAGSGEFVANDCALAPDARLWLLTGPNMAGKSTFLRQNALIAVLAQAGCYVPARACSLGAVNRLFSRVGAADDLARGRSTFMVEMVETAAILNQAGPRALVILDEIGRGTATFDGLSIAWATIEHLHAVNRCRALFATHYHELTGLAATLDGLACHTMRVREWKGEAVFLYEVAPGTADRSYGIHVARLAGLPPAVVERAETVLKTLESQEGSAASSRLADDLPLFTAARPKGGGTAAPEATDPALAQLRATDADSLTPREALELVYRLKSLAGE